MTEPYSLGRLVDELYEHRDASESWRSLVQTAYDDLHRMMRALGERDHSIRKCLAHMGTTHDQDAYRAVKLAIANLAQQLREELIGNDPGDVPPAAPMDDETDFDPAPVSVKTADGRQTVHHGGNGVDFSPDAKLEPGKLFAPPAAPVVPNMVRLPNGVFVQPSAVSYVQQLQYNADVAVGLVGGKRIVVKRSDEDPGTNLVAEIVRLLNMAIQESWPDSKRFVSEGSL